MLDHIGFPVTDFARSKAFYTRALEPLGFRIVTEVNLSEDGEDGYAGFGDERPHFWIGTGKPLTGRLHVAFAAKNRGEVRAFTRRRWRPAGSITALPACARTTTRTTMAPSCSIPTATISRP